MAHLSSELVQLAGREVIECFDDVMVALQRIKAWHAQPPGLFRRRSRPRR
jgi:hypothetical protein